MAVSLNTPLPPPLNAFLREKANIFISPPSHFTIAKREKGKHQSGEILPLLLSSLQVFSFIFPNSKGFIFVFVKWAENVKQRISQSICTHSYKQAWSLQSSHTPSLNVFQTLTPPKQQFTHSPLHQIQVLAYICNMNIFIFE